MKKYCVFLLLFALLFAPVGCQKRESTVELLPYSQPSVDKSGLAVNITTLKIHFDVECRHVKGAKEENLRYTPRTTDTVNILFSMGYTPCEDCAD